MTTNTATYTMNGKAIYSDRQVGCATIRFAAKDIHKERTGVHGTITLTLMLPEDRGVYLEQTYLNIDRIEDRIRLANAAHKQLEQADEDLLSEAIPRETIQRELSLFCNGLWDASLSRYAPVALVGDPAIDPIDMVLSPFVIEDGGTMVFAPPGRGKSYIAIAMAVSVDADINTLWEIRSRRTLLINLERSSKSIQRRIGRVNLALGLDAMRPLLTLNARGRSLHDVLDSARKAVKDYGVGFVILDSISRAGMGDLNENRPVNNIIDELNGLCDTWLALAHTPRSDETHVYGSIHFEAGVDIGVRLLSQRRENALGIGLQMTKSNDAPFAPLEILGLDFDAGGLTAIGKARASEFPELMSNRTMSLTEEVEQYLLDCGKATVPTIVKDTGHARSKIYEVLKDQRFVRLGKEGHEVFYAVRGQPTEGSDR